MIPARCARLRASAICDRVLEGLVEGERPALQPLGERPPLAVLHHQVVDAVLLPDIVQSTDVGVIQRRDGPRFPLEADPEPGVARELRREDFDRDVPRQTRIPREIDLAHPARADALDDLVGPEPGSPLDLHGWKEDTPPGRQKPKTGSLGPARPG